VDVLQLAFPGEVVAAVLAGLGHLFWKLPEELDALRQMVFVPLVAVAFAFTRRAQISTTTTNKNRSARELMNCQRLSGGI
jgi:fructose-specific phosphotransferase system IIC component